MIIMVMSNLTQPHLIRRLVYVSRSVCITYTHMISYVTDMLKEMITMEIRIASYPRQLTSEENVAICMSTINMFVLRSETPGRGHTTRAHLPTLCQGEAGVCLGTVLPLVLGRGDGTTFKL